MKILIIGLGSIGKKHIDAIYSQGIPVKIYALRRQASLGTYRDVINVLSLDEIPYEIDFAIISNVSSSHEKSILQMAEYGCPLFIEKPVLSNLSAASDISARLNSEGITTYVACNLRFHPALQYLQNYLLTIKPRINEVNIYCGSYLPDWRPGVDFRKIYSSDETLGGGVHLDLIHEVDYCTWLFGFPDSVMMLKRNVSSLGISAVDNARFFFCYPTFTAGINLNYHRRDPKRTIEIVMENDTIEIDLIGSKVISLVTGEVLFKKSFNMVETYTKQMEYFIGKLNANERPMNCFDYGVRVLKLVYE